MALPCILVTRPEPEASAWAQQLRQRGLNAQALPLILIAPPRRIAPAPTGPWRALMFVSGHAVQHFFAGSPANAQALRPARAWAPGPGTARALLTAGVSAAEIDTPAHDARQFDSEHLWQVVQHQIRPADRVLIVRGIDCPEEAPPSSDLAALRRGSGREWLADRIRQAGGEVDYQVVYERRPPVAEPALLSRARAAAEDGSVWLFSSSEAVRNLQACLPELDWHGATALVTHPRIGEAATAAGFGRVLGTRPALDEVVASIESGS